MMEKLVLVVVLVVLMLLVLLLLLLGMVMLMEVVLLLLLVVMVEMVLSLLQLDVHGRLLMGEGKFNPVCLLDLHLLRLDCSKHAGRIGDHAA